MNTFHREKPANRLMVLTIVFLSWLFNLREKQEWKNVEALVKKRIGKYHYSLFDILARFIYPEIFRPHPNKEKVLEILKALDGIKKSSFNYARKSKLLFQTTRPSL